jgi:hypothetical protein
MDASDVHLAISKLCNSPRKRCCLYQLVDFLHTLSIGMENRDENNDNYHQVDGNIQGEGENRGDTMASEQRSDDSQKLLV